MWVNQTTGEEGMENHRLDSKGDLLPLYQKLLQEDMDDIKYLSGEVKYWKTRVHYRCFDRNTDLYKSCQEALRQAKEDKQLEKERMVSYYGTKAIDQLLRRIREEDGTEKTVTRATNNIFAKTKHDHLGYT